MHKQEIYYSARSNDLDSFNCVETFVVCWSFSNDGADCSVPFAVFFCLYL